MNDESSVQARALWVVRPGAAEIRAERLREAGAHELVVETLYSGVSRGTESLVFAGRVPQSEQERMRAPHQQGSLALPVKYGYQNVGRVTTGPDALVGKTVFCLYPHQDRYVVGTGDVVEVPEAVPPGRAVLAANLETAINGVWDAQIGPGDRVAVVGGGVVGCLVAYVAARIPGCEVEIVDVNPARADIATQLGTGFALPANARASADVVVHASGNPAGLVTALSLAGREATIVEMSWYGDRAVELPLGAAFHSQRLAIRSSQVGGIPPARAPRWTHRRRLALAVSLLGDPALDALISGESEFHELPAAMAEVCRGGALCHRVRYPAADNQTGADRSA